MRKTLIAAALASLAMTLATSSAALAQDATSQAATHYSVDTTPAGKLIDDALENMGGFDALMSEVRNTNDELAKKRQRKQAEAAAMTPQQIEKQKIAATDDPELLEDEPQAP